MIPWPFSVLIFCGVVYALRWAVVIVLAAINYSLGGE